MHRPHHVSLILTGVAFAWLSGCAPDESAAPPKASAAQSPQPIDLSRASPTETIDQLRRWHLEGRFSLIEAHLLPEERASVIEHLRAVDRLTAAARRLQQSVRKKLGLTAALTYSQYTQVGNIAGVFSTEVTLLGERAHDDQATVSYQIADRLPLESVKLMHRDRLWVLSIEPVAGVTKQLLQLAQMLERMADRVDTEEWTAETLRAEIELRQTSILRKLDELTAAARANK